MKREEKNLQSLQNILESALREFSGMGYGLSSINTICNSGGISKGNLYHYFKDKDSVYLSCIQNCFDALVDDLRDYAEKENGNAQERLEGYFDRRFAFFAENPAYHRLFCEAIVSPPRHLAAQIREIKSEFDRLNMEILKAVLDRLPIRPDMRREDVLQFFRQYQDYFIASYASDHEGEIDAPEYESRCRRALDILLYGVVAREGAENG